MGSGDWWLATLGLTLLRLWLALWVPLGDDEGYYWVWSRHLAASYYDHPPMVAWLVALSTHVLGSSLVALRLPFVACGTLSAVALRALVERITGDGRLARESSMLFQVVPVFVALGFMVIPDAPLILFWLLAGLAAHRLERRPGLASAVLLGVALGAAALSKYIAGLLWVSLAGYLVLQFRAKSVAPLAAAFAVAVLIASPVLWWNAGHDWASFRYQFVSRHQQAHFDLGRLALYLGSQALYLTPPLLALLAVATLGVGARRVERGDRLLWWLGAPTALVFLAVAGFTRFKPNWAAPGYATLVVVAVRGASRWRDRSPRLAQALGVATVASAIACAAFPLVQLARPLFPLPPRADPTVDMAEWPAIAARAERAATKIRSETGAMPFYAAGRYQLASRLEFYLPGHPDVFSLNPGRDAYDDWQDLASLRGRDCIFVTSDRFPTAPQQLARWDSTRVEARLVVATRGREQFRVTVYVVRGYRPGPPDDGGRASRAGPTQGRELAPGSGDLRERVRA